jgi:hypothetical protein
MMQHPRYRFLLRSVYTAVIQSDLTASDMRALAVELRRGQFPDELSYMLEKVSDHFQERPGEKRLLPDRLKVVERLMKDKRISKSDLINILRSIDGENARRTDGLTTRSILQNFFSSATSRQIDKLNDILQAAGGTDPYLKGISER